MRRLVTFVAMFVVIVLLLLPTVVGRLFGRPSLAPELDGADALPIKVYLPELQTVQEMPLGEYLKGVVAAEMPPEFATEALKAQFVVARTYALRRMQRFNGVGKGGCPLHPEADVCADPATGQAYMNQEQTEKKLGKAAALAYWRRLSQLQATTAGLVITYHGELIDPLYHSVSGRYTEDAGDYYNHPVPYLVPVDDHWGSDSPKLLDSRRFTPDELSMRISDKDKVVPVSSVSAAPDGRAPVEIVTRTGTGRVKTVRVGTVLLSGREFRERLGLRSTDFTLSFEDGHIVIQTHGYGHGVGMSQYGADGMARVGKKYEEILKHYYQGVSIGPLFSN